MNKIYKFSDPIRMVEGKHGFLTYNLHDEYIGKSLELYGEYCEQEIELFKKIIKPTFSVWEIGANTGSQATALSRLASKGKYIGFEPQIELYKLLITNLALNGCENATALNIALGDQSGYISLPNINYHLPFNFGSVSMLGNHSNNQKIEIKKIDQLEWMPYPDFIKIDVEGMELMVLKGGERMIRHKQPILYVENDRIDRSPELIELLWNFGYELFWHITPYFNPGNFFHNPHNIYGDTYSFNMLCVNEIHQLKIESINKIKDKNSHPLK